MDQAKRGADALTAGKYADAINAYTAAIKVSPESPDYHIKRSIAYQRSTPADYTSALSDADRAVVFAQKRAKRELIIQAQLRRAIALFGLERYADAKFILDIVKRLDPKEKTLAIWENKIETKLSALAEDDSKRQVTAKELPDISQTTPSSDSADTTASVSTKPSSTSSASTSSSAPAQTPASKIRNDWYQNNDSVTFTLLAKGVPKDKAVVEIQPRSLTISFPILSESTFDFSLDPLYGAVDVSQSTYKIMSTKIEVVLKKAQPGQKWHALESSGPVNDDSSAPSTVPSELLRPSAATSQGPAYPTSSRSGPKNWDKLAQDLTTKKKSSDKKDKDDEDDDYDYDAEGGDAVNSFFSKLYSGADPDTKRAMMKSFSESNGTALSTNWEEVKKQKMETTPPDGMEAKKWGA